MALHISRERRKPEVPSSEPWAETALQDDDGFGAVDFQNRHAVERTVSVVFCSRVCHVVRSDDYSNIGLREIRVDLLHRV